VKPALLLGALALLGAGCGYTTGIRLSDSKATLAVGFFGNESKFRDLERELQLELTDSVTRLVEAPLVTPGRADYELRGTILDYARRGGIRSADNVLLETGVRITVRARLVRVDPAAAAVAVPGGSGSEGEGEGRGRPGESVLGELTFFEESGFRLEEPLGEIQARRRVLRSIADRLVLDLLVPLAYEAEP
jgi:hypothetical protein